MRRRRTFLRAAASLASAALLASLAPATAGASRPHVISKRLVAPGVRFIRMLDRSGPFRIFVLRLNLALSATLDVGLASRSLGGLEKPSSMAARQKAVAAINGDFPLVVAGHIRGRPMHDFAEDGFLRFSSHAPGPNVAVSHDEKQWYLGAPNLDMEAFVPAIGQTRELDRWNDGDPVGNEVAAFTDAGNDRGATDACSARLLPAAPPKWTRNRTGVRRKFVVDKVACKHDIMEIRSGVVLSARQASPAAAWIQVLFPGDTVWLSWSLGWRGVLDSLGGIPLLVQDGEVVPTCTTGSFCRRHPRSGIGVTADGKVLLVVVDGRRAGWSVGMNLTEFAQLFQFLGATSAMNLDGGGSSVMVVQGKVVNKPSDGRERRVSSAVLVLSGRDKDEAAFNDSTKSPRTAASAGGSGVGAFRAALLDPASTGGMLDALARGALGQKPARLDPALSALVREFRSGR